MLTSSFKKNSSLQHEIVDSARGSVAFSDQSDRSADAGGVPVLLTTDGIMSSAEVAFDQFCQDALREAGEISAAQKDSILEDLGLRFEHPGEYVAYIDRYQIRNRIRRLSREVLAHSRDLSEVKAAFSHFGNDKRAKVEVEYLDPLSDDLELIHDLPFR